MIATADDFIKRAIPGTLVKFVSETYGSVPLSNEFIGQEYVFDQMVEDYHVLRLSWGTIERNSFRINQVFLSGDQFTVTFGGEEWSQFFIRTYEFIR